MRCPACGHDNRAQAKFCEECGAAQPARPAAPPAPAPPRHLAERILTTRAALLGERKAVTVLFADIQGSMALAEQVDAEEWHTLMQGFSALLADGVHRFEGTVVQYTGDGVMALFGAPLAHEDHAARACHAALHLAAALRAHAQTISRERGLQFSLRIGLNSGEVVVGAIGDDLHMEYTAQGHTVGLASRMEQLCEPGRVYLTAHTAALVEGLFALEDLGLFEVKGVREPLRVFALLGHGPARTRLAVAQARGLSRFVGRAAELAALEAALAAAAAGRGAVVALAADAGTGKSRLCLEFTSRCRARGHAVVEAVALAHGAAVPFLPLLALLRALLDIGERDAPAVVRQKTAGALLLLDDAFKADLPALFALLGAPDAERPPSGDAPAAGALRRALDALLRARAAARAAVVVLEDLHWLDAASDALLRELVAGLATAPVLLLCDFRPAYDGAWLRAAGARWLALAPLERGDTGALLDELLGDDASLAPLRGRLQARAAGNPFFLEELVRSLAQSGTLSGRPGAYTLAGPLDDAGIPATVQAVLAARIDRLAPADKDVLLSAAVIGKTFAAPLLGAVTGLGEAALQARLAALTAVELIVPLPDAPQPAFAFTHPLTQEVAYGVLLQTQRAGRHAAVARAQAAATGDPPTAEQAALLAYHWEAAGERREAAQWQYRTARALAYTASSEAVARLRHLRTLLDGLAEDEVVVSLALRSASDLLRMGVVVALPDAEAAAIFTGARALAERLGERALLAELLSTYGDVQLMAGRRAAADALMREAGVAAQGIDDPVLQLGIALDRAQTASWAGRLREAAAAIDEAAALLGRVGDVEAIPVGLHGEGFVCALRGLTLTLAGRVGEGRAELERAIALADAGGPVDGPTIARIFAAIAGNISGAGRWALAVARHARELAARIGNPTQIQLVDGVLGTALTRAGNWREGIALLEPLLDGVEDAGMLAWYGLPLLADAWRLLGEPERAVAIAERGVALAAAAQALTAELSAQLVLATALAQARGAAAADATDAALQRAAALLEESGAEVFRPRWHFAQVIAARARGDQPAAAAQLRAGLELCAAMGLEELAEASLAELA